MRLFRFVSLAVCVASCSTLFADGPADNQWATVRQVPPPGVMIDPTDREALEGTLKTLTEKIVELRASKSAIVQTYLPDVEIFARAVKIALESAFIPVATPWAMSPTSTSSMPVSTPFSTSEATSWGASLGISLLFTDLSLLSMSLGQRNTGSAQPGASGPEQTVPIP